MSRIITEIINLWSDLNPVAGYTSGHLKELKTLFIQTPGNAENMRARIDNLQKRIDEIKDNMLKATADAVLVALKTQLDMARPSGAGPSGTGMGGVYAAADGIFYIVLKQNYQADFVPQYLEAVEEMVQFETQKWQYQEFSILVRKECLNTVNYMNGTLESLLKVRSDQSTKKQVKEIRQSLEEYKNLFYIKGLDSDQFKTYWPIFRKWDEITGPQVTPGYPASLQNYYCLTQSADEIKTMAHSWLQQDLPVTIHIAERITALPFVKCEGNLQAIWDKVSNHYKVDFDQKLIEEVKNRCVAFGAQYIIKPPPGDKVKFDPTPDYLVNLVTGGEDFAVNYLEGKNAYSQLYLTASKNTSLLTMINILVHEASHGYNFVLSAEHAQKLLNLNTSLEVPMTEGMAFYREYQYWAAAQDLLGQDNLTDVQKEYLELYGNNPEEQEQGVLCAQLETYIWRIIRYIRALCDVNVNGGKMTYTDFIAWAASATGLSEETLHGECFTLLASPGYAPCYAVGGATYAMMQKKGINKTNDRVSEIDFNTFASEQGFYAWPIAVELMNGYVSTKQ